MDREHAITRITCPFSLCGGFPHVLPNQPDPLIEPHNMPDYSSKSTTGVPCPASLMRWPMNYDQKRLLEEMEEQLRPKKPPSMPEHERQSVLNELNRQGLRVSDDVYQHGTYNQGKPWAWMVPQDYASSPQGILHMYCLTRHMPGQPCPGPASQPLYGQSGRTNPPDHAPDWALGGRADEEVTSSNEDVPGIVPPYVQGVRPTESKRGEMAIDDTIGSIRAANERATEAFNAFSQAHDQLSEAAALINAVGGESPGESLRNIMSDIQTAKQLCDDGKAAVDKITEKGTEFINRLLS